MNQPVRLPILLAGLTLVTLAAIPGCGKKTLPVPPREARPQPIADLRYRLDAQGLALVWSRPSLAESGAKVKKVEEFELLKAEYPLADFCASCPLVFQTTIPVSSPVARRVGQSEEVIHYDHNLKRGFRYFYKVRAVVGWQLASQDSNLISFTWEAPVGPPTGLTITAGDRRLALSWQPPAAASARGGPPEALGYSVLRSSDGEHFITIKEHLRETGFVDHPVDNDTRYYYQIKAFRLAQGPGLPGEAGPVVSAQARDTTPPDPPADLTRIKTDQGVRLLWSMAPDQDVAGYRVYRRLGLAKEPVLLGLAGANTLHFTDELLPTEEAVWYYSVTAIDRADPPNESRPTPEVGYEVVH